MFKTAIILAGGYSSRMGFDKQFLYLDEEWIICKMIKQLRPIFDHFVIVTNKPEYYTSVRATIVKDHYLGKGPLAGLHAGLLASKSIYAFVIACDMPSLSLPLIRYQQDILRKNCKYEALVSLSSERYLNPFHGFYSNKLIEGLEKILIEDSLSIREFLNNYIVCYLNDIEIEQFIKPEKLFINLNTTDDLVGYINRKENC